MNTILARAAMMLLAFTAVFLSAADFRFVTAEPPASSPAGQTEIQATMEAFEKHQNRIQSEYAAAQADIEETYREYQRIAREAFRAYEQKLLQYWPEAQTSTKKRWVEYSPDYQTRRTVDFENQKITIDIITDTDDTAAMEREFSGRLQELIRENQQEAFQRDQLAQAIEQKLRERSRHTKTDRLQTDPILTRVVTGKTDPTIREIKQAAQQLQNRATITRHQTGTPGKQIVRLRTSLPPDTIQRKAAQYQADVQRFARNRGLNDALVLAVIHTESAFNPMARSPVPAYGLMQIVPQSAGRDVSRRLFGQPLLLSPSYLYNSTNNINAGTTYLYILYYDYLKPVKNPTSRLYCAIAAYNTGAGNVARTFTDTTDIKRAANRINRMSPLEVYRHLRHNLPYQETRDYLERVCRRMEAYQAM